VYHRCNVTRHRLRIASPACRWANEIREAAHRDESKWAAAYANHISHRTDFTTFEQEIDYLRGWIVARHDFVRNVHLEQPLVIGESPVLDGPSSPGSPGSPDEATGSPDGHF
jgi:hypothetical protein